MFCPGCGSEERQHGRFCRACGADLSSVRLALEKPDAITASAISAREQIGSAFADKIKELRTNDELGKAATELLPALEKLLASPEEKRLRRIRTGIYTWAIGCAVALAVVTAGPGNRGDDLFNAAFIVLFSFLIGLCFMLNGWFFTIPPKHMFEDSPKMASLPESENTTDVPKASGAQSREQVLSSSVTEHTTHRLP
jgi:hypothetical protein